jgi:hypothetical protein
VTVSAFVSHVEKNLRQSSVKTPKPREEARGRAGIDRPAPDDGRSNKETPMRTFSIAAAVALLTISANAHEAIGTICHPSVEGSGFILGITVGLVIAKLARVVRPSWFSKG